MLLLKGDEARLHDGRFVEVVNVWGAARCHAEVRCDGGRPFPIIAEKDVDEVLRRTAIRKSKFVDS